MKQIKTTENLAGKFIVLEGLDGSGKTTQSKILLEKLVERGHSVRTLNFPAYDNPSSVLVKLYLAGEIGGLDEVNIYAATSFFAADRYITYQTDWKADWLAGKLLFADRYTTSNLIYQMAKLPFEKWEEYIAWLYDYEYCKLELPKPDTIIFLDVSPITSAKLLEKRYQGDNSRKDIHERDMGYLEKCREAALFAAEILGWTIVRCDQSGEMRSIEEIAADIAVLIFE